MKKIVLILTMVLAVAMIVLTVLPSHLATHTMDTNTGATKK
ncbi:MAG: hypothetical protein ACRDAO_01225 [Culicoidibacterales bacterium]